MIREYSLLQLAEAEATPEPRHVWIDGNRIVVITGEDMPPDTPGERVIPPHVFRDRFTQSELDAILNATYTGDIVARRLLLKVQTATGGVPLDSVEVVGGLRYCESKGWIAAGRAGELRV